MWTHSQLISGFAFVLDVRVGTRVGSGLGFAQGCDPMVVRVYSCRTPKPTIPSIPNQQFPDPFFSVAAAFDNLNLSFFQLAPVECTYSDSNYF